MCFVALERCFFDGILWDSLGFFGILSGLFATSQCLSLPAFHEDSWRFFWHARGTPQTEIESYLLFYMFLLVGGCDPHRQRNTLTQLNGRHNQHHLTTSTNELIFRL